MPQEKRKLTEAEVGMAKSLTKLKTPMTKKEELQAVIQRAKLLKENKALGAAKPKYTGKDMTPVMMTKAYEKRIGKPPAAKRIVGVFTMKKK